MKISIKNMRIMYPDIGNNNKSGMNPDKKGICCLTPFNSLSGKRFEDIAPYIRDAIKKGIEDHPPVNAIKGHIQRGVSGIYNCETFDNEKIIIKKIGEKTFSVVGGNHRVLALVLLDEKNIETGKGKCILCE
ncbi:MAG: hypothetical protein GF329_02805 [Candidatus Lokiarchaeota archaeon]|nr:hypothetical protein [Candidatus Lokiarchaeota archaeon]